MNQGMIKRRCGDCKKKDVCVLKKIIFGGCQYKVKQ